MKFNEFLSKACLDNYHPKWSTIIKTQISYNQRELLDCVHNTKYTTVYKGRQDGVTTALALYTFWNMLANPGFHALIVGHSSVSDKFNNLIKSNPGFYSGFFQENSKSIKLQNGSHLFYQSYNSHLNRGMSFDLIIAEDFGEMVRGRERNILRNDLIMSLIQCTFRKEGKLVITTSDMSMKSVLDTIGFQEVYGHFFSGKRSVLVEKLSVKNLEF